MKAAFPATLASYRFVDLVTFRSDGRAVSSPVLFVPDGGRLLVRTSRRSGKVLRMRRTDAVEVAACDSRGRRLGDGIPARAQILNHDALAPALGALHARYPIAGRLFTVLRWLRREPNVIIEVRPRD